MTWAVFAFAMLAAYRVTRLIVTDTITAPPRDALFAWLGARASKRWASWLLDLLGCPWCTSVWVAGAAVAVLAAVGLVAVGSGWAAVVLAGMYWMALAAAVGVLWEITDRIGGE